MIWVILRTKFTNWSNHYKMVLLWNIKLEKQKMLKVIEWLTFRSNNEEIEDHEDQDLLKRKIKNFQVQRMHKFRKKDPIKLDTSIKGNKFSSFPERFIKLTRLQCFKKFLDENISDHHSHHRNLHSTQVTRKSVATTCEKTKSFSGIHMKRTIVKMH